ncbi:MAG: 23S rRNA (adenine(2503)-C(2))-methyltransferase RlmN [Candidatus Omnitrophica bacterium]|nr:23S rRNA (adenine(2503)-C(2))-methyltransferase RlmN [Candidatus Omnitrophota bacterium]
MNKKDIKNFTLEELKEVMVELQEPNYRAEQIFYWLYQRGISDFNKMSDISKILRVKLDKAYDIGRLHLHEHLRSCDGTEKFLFRLFDGNFIESVLIYAKQRKTICLSSQVGCRFACSFCASGSRGFTRDLTPSEITAQILFLQHELKHKITNYVFMGMGEPLDNFENVKKALMIMNDSRGMDIGARRITLSTCGVIPGIGQVSQLGLQVNLSVSLHAPNDKLRSELLPINKHYPLAILIKACEDFINKTGRMITLEYVLIKGKNDSLQDADEFVQIAKRLKAKVNLILYSRVPKLNFRPVNRKELDSFMQRLIERGVQVTLRESKGEDIQATCGQLAGRKRE